jgi:mercuric reductase
MNTEVNTALKRLDSILPLISGLKSLSGDDAALYCKLINSYVQQGRTLTREDVDELVGNAEQALNNIVGSKLIVLDTDGNPAGAYPFTSEEREHKVHVNDVTVHCMCALDALAVSPMFNKPTVIDSQCRVSGEKVHIEQNGTEFSGGTLDVWFGINWGAAATDTVCAASLCMEMMFLANENVARDWLAESLDTREIFDLPSAVEFAAGFFVPLAENCQLTA